MAAETTGERAERSAIDSYEQAVQFKRVELARMEANLTAMKQALPSYDGPKRTTEWMGFGIMKAAKLLLAEVGKPLETAEIADGILQRGVQTKSQSFRNTVYTTLGNSPDVSRTSDNKWELRKNTKRKDMAAKRKKK